MANAGAIFSPNYISTDRLKICTKCVLVCASPIAGLLASAASQSFFNFCLSAHTVDDHLFQVFCQLFQHKWASNLCQVYASMCQSNCWSVENRTIFFVLLCSGWEVVGWNLVLVGIGLWFCFKFNVHVCSVMWTSNNERLSSNQINAHLFSTSHHHHHHQ